MDRERFRALVTDALDEIPDPFLPYLENVQVVVDDEPAAELIAEMGLDPRRDTLFGLYEGVPITERGDSDSGALPDRITIFYRPLVHAFRSPGALRREIRKTVIHEIAHFFGLDDEAIEGDGY